MTVSGFFRSILPWWKRVGYQTITKEKKRGKATIKHKQKVVVYRHVYTGSEIRHGLSGGTEKKWIEWESGDRTVLDYGYDNL